MPWDQSRGAAHQQKLTDAIVFTLEYLGNKVNGISVIRVVKSASLARIMETKRRP